MVYKLSFLKKILFCILYSVCVLTYRKHLASLYMYFLYRDIKGANILVDPNGRVKLADFGMAKHVSMGVHISHKYNLLVHYTWVKQKLPKTKVNLVVLNGVISYNDEYK